MLSFLSLSAACMLGLVVPILAFSSAFGFVSVYVL